MQIAHNSYILKEDHAVLRIYSAKTGVHDVLIDLDMVSYLGRFNWCYEASKQLVYCMNLRMDVAADVFNYKTPRIYLWKYIAWLETKCTFSEWTRKNKMDYRRKSGVIRKHPICS